MTVGNLDFPCALGGSGRSHLKREGDGATPFGTFRLERVLYRADRIQRPRTVLPVSLIGDSDGWCETVGDRNYNRQIKLPYPASHELLKRQDRLYDIIVVLSHNQRPRIQGLGSAVFFHLAREDYAPTAGCVAVSLRDMRTILGLCGIRSAIVTAS
ncbi:MAG: L,D-transpeptidase family protein [Rhizobiales bacterium]|nr:L,D-transpeptidase family protein [Hyphomicrobiales bacterium]